MRAALAKLLMPEPKKKRQIQERPAPMPIDDIVDLPAGKRVILHFPPVLCNPNTHVHERLKARSRKQYRIACAYDAHAAGFNFRLPVIRAATGKVHMEVAFFRPPGVALDRDNVIASFKAGQDGIADALHIDDSRFVIDYQFRREARSCVVVTLLENSEVGG
jgi:crossover junction endodeoxyribonuclease RusA